ncbi:MAG: class II aldolase/adducin family protein [Schwartzia sp. (in: firmicutes)]
MLEHLKEIVLQEAKRAQAMGLCRHRSGNFSLKDKESGLLCLTPSGVDRETMTVADIVVVDGAGKVVEAAPGRRPTSETLMHLAAYDARPDISAVVHTHSRFAKVLAVLRQEIPPIVAEMAHLRCQRGRIPVAQYARAGSPQLAASVVEPLKESDAILLASHGVLTVDAASLAEALLKAAYVEEIAEVYCHARLLAKGEPPLIPPEDLDLRR